MRDEFCLLISVDYKTVEVNWPIDDWQSEIQRLLHSTHGNLMQSVCFKVMLFRPATIDDRDFLNRKFGCLFDKPLNTFRIFQRRNSDVNSKGSGRRYLGVLNSESTGSCICFIDRSMIKISLAISNMNLVAGFPSQHFDKVSRFRFVEVIYSFGDQWLIKESQTKRMMFEVGLQGEHTLSSLVLLFCP